MNLQEFPGESPLHHKKGIGKIRFLKTVSGEDFAFSLIPTPQDSDPLESVIKLEQVPPNPYLN